MKLIIILAFLAVAASGLELIPLNVGMPTRYTAQEYQQILKSRESKDKIDGAGGKIINGNLATGGQFPWQVSLVIDSTYFCGGSVISDKWVLTAAHCADGATSIALNFGSLTPTGTGANTVQQTSTLITVHENYNSTNIQNDIALVEIPTALVFTDRIMALRLPQDPLDTLADPGNVGRVSGWGKTSDAATSTAQFLNWVDLNIVPNTDCSAVYGTEIIFDSTLCTSGTGFSTCNGDSGGALAVAEADSIYTQVGIVSFGASAGCELNYPLGFTRVTSYLDWIAAHAV